MSAGVSLTGIQELARELAQASGEVRAEARDVVRDTTETAAAEIRRAYPEKTGTLQRRVRTEYPVASVLVGVVLSTAPHSHLYEFGSKDRRTRSGANRGAMPAARPPVVVPVAQRKRRQMLERLKDVVRRQGFTVA